MGLLGAAVGVAFIAGPALGGLVIGAHQVDHEDFVRVCLLSAALATAAVAAALFLFRETLPKEKRSKAEEPRVSRFQLLFSRATLLRFVTVMLIMITAQALMEATFGIWADAALQWGPRQVGWALAGLGVGAVLLQGGGAGRISQRAGERPMLIVGLCLFTAGFGGLAVTHTVPVLIVSLLVLVTGIGLATPALNALIAAQAEEHERGAVMGLSQSVSALGRVIGPMCAGAIFDSFGHGAPFGVAAALMLGALFVASSEPAVRQVSSAG
jgi:DHA1 family tetracycline resistance protein-like MFS transporter